MQHQITIAGNSKAELVKGLHAHLAFLNGTEATSSATTGTTTARSRGGSKKEEADTGFGEDPQHGEEEETETAFDDSGEETESEVTESEESEEEEAPAVTSDDVRKACGAFSQKLIKAGMSMADAKTKVREILKKNFKVTLVDQLDEEVYEKAITVIKAAAKKLK